ncbi:hypothetical protein [Bradyrhizobium sp. SZCCHNR2012]|uniref:hypothetical protein n=1 Tax=Bradyrhizobium sp. SZCCHNR2012 TaxID=3057377 RepID=UPI0028E2E919|nr:hypothetical protein [Bradyrhizobium sp. SZCCHNR2012]
MELRSLGQGIEVEIDVRPTSHGYMLIHRLRGKGSYTVTCCCEGMGCVSKTCTYPDGEPPSPTCDCTGSSPSITC